MLAELKKLTKRSQVDMSRRWDEVAFGEQIQMLEEIQQGGHAITDFYTLVTTTDAGPAHPELTLHGRVAYHGSRDGITGPPEPSESGRLRPGFYLTSNEQASRFAIYDPKWAAYPAGGLPEPQYEGTVHAFDLSDLRLKIRIGGSGAIGSGAASPR